MTQWINDVIFKHSIADVATSLGMQTNKGNQISPCPACGKNQRGSQDKRAPVGIVTSNGKERWQCYRGDCGAFGDAVDLVSYSLHGCRFSQVESSRDVKNFFSVSSIKTTQRSKVDVHYNDLRKEQYPPEQDIIKITEMISRNLVAKGGNKEVDNYLNYRFINPRKLLATGIFERLKDFDYNQLTHVVSSSGKEIPFWTGRMAERYPIIFPMYDVTGTVRSFQGRAISSSVSPKSMCPVGFSKKALFFANKEMLKMLKKESEFNRVWITEGEIDFATMMTRTDEPIMGIDNGSIDAFKLIKWPEDTEFIIATHNDKAGDRYAELIARYVLNYDVKRLVIEDDINEFVKQNSGDLDGIDSYIKTYEYIYELKGKIGINKLENAHKQISDMDKQLRVPELMKLMDITDLLAYSFLHCQKDFDKITFSIRSIRGLATPMESIRKQIEIEAKNLVRQKVLDAAGAVGPDSNVPLMTKFISDEEVIMPIERNVVNILLYDNRMNGRLKYNELKAMCEYKGDTIEDSAVIDVMLFMQDNYAGFRMEKNIVGACMNYVGEQKENRYNPAREMFDEIYEGTDCAFAPAFSDPEDLFLYYFRVDDEGDSKKNELYRAYAKYFLMSVIGRTYEDEYRVEAFPTLIGKQGAGKSSSLEVLAMKPEFFSNTDIDIKSKDAKLQVKGNLIYEIAEGGALSAGKASHKAIKGFLSAKNYDLRKPYKSAVERVSNSHVFIITTNEENIDFLSDATGSRRFHAMMVGVGGEIRIEELRRDMRYIWARALHMYWGTGEYEDEEPGKNFYLNKTLEDFSQVCNQRFSQIDPWLTYIEAYLMTKWKDWARSELNFGNADVKKLYFTIEELFEELEIPKERQTQKSSARIVDIITKLKCDKAGRVRMNGKRISAWSIPKSFYDIKDL